MKHRIAVYDLATGAIQRLVTLTFVGRPPPEVIAAKAIRQAREGQAVIELPPDFTGDDTTHRVEGGALIPIGD